MALIEGHAGQQAVAALQAVGTDVMFTLNGGHVWPLYDAARDRGMRVVDTRHEQAATFAAEAYAKLTRRPGLAVLTAGPGITNGVSAITSAHFNGSPLVVLGGRAPSGAVGAGSLQELDHVPIVASITKAAGTVTDPTRAGVDVAAAVRTAMTPHRGPVFLDFPLDVFGPSAGEVPEPDECQGRARRPTRLSARRGDGRGGRATGVHRRFRRVLGRRVGRAARCGGAPARAVLSSTAGPRHCCPPTTSWPSSALVACSRRAPTWWSCSAPRSTSGSGSVPSARRRSPTWSTRPSSAPGTSTCTRWSATNGSCSPRWPITLRHPPGPRGLDRRAARGRAAPRRRRGAARGRRRPDQAQPHLRRAARRLERDAVVICDGGDFASYAGKFVEVFEPGCWLDTGPYGCLGNGIGYAIAARVARPDARWWCCSATVPPASA
jgi:acetolactate synthase I/II/III large subunit